MKHIQKIALPLCLMLALSRVVMADDGIIYGEKTTPPPPPPTAQSTASAGGDAQQVQQQPSPGDDAGATSTLVALAQLAANAALATLAIF